MERDSHTEKGGYLSRKSSGCAGSLTQTFHNSRKPSRCNMLLVITVSIGAVQLARVRRHGFEDHLHTLHSVRLSANFFASGHYASFRPNFACALAGAKQGFE